MTNRKGTDFETPIADYLRERRSDFICRAPKAGARDKGDILNFRVGGQPVAIECKNTVKTDLAGWVKEAEVEAENMCAIAGIVISKRKGKTDPAQQYVVCTLDALLAIIEIAESKS